MCGAARHKVLGRWFWQFPPNCSSAQWPLLQQITDGLIVLIETEDGLAEAADLVDVRFSNCRQPLTKVSNRYLLLVDVAVIVRLWIAPGTFHVRPF